RRARDFLSDLNVATREFDFHVAHLGAKPMTAIRTSTRASVSAVKDLILWPRQASADWCKGFLAGIFDAEGSCAGTGSLRIANTDDEIIDWTTFCLRRLGLPHVVEDHARVNRLRYVRVRGGLRNQLRFFHAVDPAITRKRSIEGVAMKSNA